MAGPEIGPLRRSRTYRSRGQSQWQVSEIDIRLWEYLSLLCCFVLTGGSFLKRRWPEFGWFIEDMR